jgi:hypothetical protein
MEAHRTTAELEAGLEAVRRAPRDAGVLELVVRRPGVGAREIVAEGTLDPARGLLGDNWESRPSPRTPDGSPHPDMQVNVMGARTAELLAGPRDRWALAGDQLYVDLDLSEDNVPPGTRLAIGDALLEVTPQPHTGCAKFRDRFGADALKLVNSPEGRRLHLRGINARVVRGGTVRPGNEVRRIAAEGGSEA